MHSPAHPFHQLFEQLGLPSDDAAIRAFLKANSPLAEHLELAAAPFWTPAQASLLREAISEDADWAEVVDALSLALREPAAG
ncbi:DUF2789 domain-containing protein [Pseudomonas sp. N040]|uniref:DUF2789 domain-containing protein n=1 Tax=Pseudomonas sp. N040 TaxID=2785325 RepID=UPI0018A25878|nr:DUF2789 domain-containing protein [Pseudomonas sp. N040]MBF7730207.1 DUF2789 domain-containing protein [Pseudomonas sp. N040]MBW7013849.1 DUF2789 domain-containing protein [Pseudomonas sp. N040]